MATILEPPPSLPSERPLPELLPLPSAPPLPPPAPRRGLLDRYGQHIWMAAVSVAVIAIAVAPIAFGLLGRSTSNATPAATQAVTITASEFKFSPSSIQVPLGQKVAFTLDNKGVVEHDITVPSLGEGHIHANAGQVATGELTFDKSGVYDFICSIPGHKEAGTKGTLTVVDGSTAATSPAPAQQQSTAAAPDIKPLPAESEVDARANTGAAHRALRARLRQVRPRDAQGLSRVWPTVWPTSTGTSTARCLARCSACVKATLSRSTSTMPPIQES